MSHRNRRLAALLLAAALLSSCTRSGPEPVGPDRSEDEPLSYWAELNGNAASARSRIAEVPFFDDWQERTGVRLKFVQPPSNQGREAISVLLASDDVPDLIEYEWINYPGGPEKAIQDGHILRLNEAMEKHAPNLTRYLREHPDIDKLVRTADGSYYAFPFIRGDERLLTYQGPIVRKDWLDELGLPVPETIGDWEQALTAFKERKGAQAPLTLLGTTNPLNGVEGGAFIGAFGIAKGFYVEEGKVRFGPAEPGYRDFLQLMRSWYEKGLLDPNFAAVDSVTQDASMTSGRSGASVWNAGAGIGSWLPMLRKQDSDAELAAAPYPVLRRGDRPKFGQRAPAVGPSGAVAVSARSERVEEAVRLMDFGYGEEGHMLFNFGAEGKSYELRGGYPAYTDLIFANPEQLSMPQTLAMYTRASYFGPFVQDIRYQEQYFRLPEQREAVRIWSNTDAEEHALPNLPLTERESLELSAIMQEVQAAVDEMSLKLVLGIEPMAAFESWRGRLEALGIGRALAIQQQALERYEGAAR
ncbi:extracellular solute-binding protein [Paenibacillus sp. FSL W8-1187]|uniref:ABC transporter, substrate-binding protein n=1 Tax=Paenibacillus pasadenensis TaxID=217090 RepID=A0A2N5N4A2_9BACL|nr:MULTISPECIES: extracellular solute-binding protein [Paenibacillus]PLT45163.1 ABC transporter, substrate-binding protein [Paenibacillus pasadenensis]